MSCELFNERLQVRRRPENLHAADCATYPPRVLIEQRNNPRPRHLGLQILNKKNRPIVHTNQDHVFIGSASQLIRMT